MQDRHVLLGRRAAPEGRLLWQFPAGKVEPGEDPEAAVVREVAEEVALTVTVWQRLGERMHPQTGRWITYFACSVADGYARAADAELAEVAWCTLADLPTYVPDGVYAPVYRYLCTVLR